MLKEMNRPVTLRSVRRSAALSLCCLTCSAIGLIVASSAHAVSLNLDWDQIDDEGEWLDGSLDGSFKVGTGSVDIFFEKGDGTNFASFGKPTPSISDTLNGANPNNQKSLHLQIDSEQVGLEKGEYSITMNTAFGGFGAGVQNVSFWLHDIDISEDEWQDRVILEGYAGAQVIAPSFEFLIPDASSVEIVNSFTLDGIKSVGNNTNTSDVLISFDSLIQGFSLTFTDGDDIGNINPKSHGIGIGDISFSSTDKADVPEPSSVFGFLLVTVYGVLRLKRHKLSNSPT